MNLETFCEDLHTLLESGPDVGRIIEEGRRLLAGLISDEAWFAGIIGRLHEDRTLFNEQKPSLWPNEITLCRRQDQSLLVNAYVWEPPAADIVHDHGSWGIIGALINKIGEIKYERLDDGHTEGHAHLSESASRVLEPGETTFVLPLDRGIHRMENRSDNVAITINVYGKSIHRGYVNFFYPEKRSVSRTYPPRTHKEVLLIRTLGSIGRPWATDILAKMMDRPLPDYIREECERSLSGNDGGQASGVRKGS